MNDRKYDLICIGMAIMDSIIKGFDPVPLTATGFRAESGSLKVGGDAVNESIAASKLGLRTGILCNLGNDPAGNAIENELRYNGVDTELIVRSDEHQTPVTTIFVQEDGNRKSITNSAHRYNFHPERHKDRFTDARAIILGSLFRAPFNDPEVIRSVLTCARDNGITVFADTKLPNFRILTLDDIRDSLSMIDYITPNEDEARYYSGKDTPEEMAEAFLDAGAKNVIIKLGARGSYFRNRDVSLMIPAFKTETVDATGAGDNFIAGFVSEKLKGNSDEDALVFANACGAICSTAVGAGSALKNRSQVLELIKSSTADQVNHI